MGLKLCNLANKSSGWLFSSFWALYTSNYEKTYIRKVEKLVPPPENTLRIKKGKTLVQFLVIKNIFGLSVPFYGLIRD